MPPSYQGHTVCSFESRHADTMAELIRRFGGEPISAPTMREAPLEENAEALAFADQLMAGAIDIVVLMTGVGTRMLADAAATKHSKEAFAEALGKVTTVSRGPKPVVALREMGLKPTVTAPEPNTWEDVLTAIDASVPVQGKHVAVQEYGQSSDELIKGLRERGANVTPVPIYRWELPDDLTPMRAATQAIIDGKIDYALITSATQIKHLFMVAEQDGVADALRDGFRRVCIAAVGPVAAKAAVDAGLCVDFEPDAPHMTPLVKETARLGANLLNKKRVAHDAGIDTNNWKRLDMVWPTGEGALTIADSVFMKACRREPVPYTPIWIMRQAGRYQRAYRDVRGNVSLIELCNTPEIAAEVTLMAVDRLGVDAAIIFSDILLVGVPMGFDLEYVKGDGPVIHNPVRERGDLDRLKKANADDLSFVYDALRLTRKALRPDVALIGFCGAPFTTASYYIEGGKSSNYLHCKTMMYRDPATWHGLMDRLVDLQIDYLNAQIDAGADAVQVFDSWAGALSPDDYRDFVMPHVKRLIDGVKARHPDAPVINFATGNPAILPLLKQAGGDVIGLDWRVDLAEAWEELGDDVAVMGNLDPIVLYATPSVIRERAQQILDKAAGRPGHIFNLGHGVLPSMSPENVAELVDAVHEQSTR